MNYLSSTVLLGCIFSINAIGDNHWLREHSYSYVSNPDQQNYDIEKPCHNYDVTCIQSYLKHNFGCSPVHGHGSDVHVIKRYSLDVPHDNASVVLNDVKLYGLKSGKIKTFFVDKKTDTMIMEVQFDSILLRSPSVVISYFSKGEMPKKTEDFIIFEFKHLSLTWIIEGIHDKHGVSSHVFAYMPDPHPNVTVGRGILLPSGYRERDSTWLEYINLSIAEGMVKEGPVFMNAYLETMLCDFGQL